MVQSLDIISVNLWAILISLANLLILFLIVKKFLFGPVKSMMEKRKQEIEKEYSDASDLKQEASRAKEEYEGQLKNAKLQADEILTQAASAAKLREEKIVSLAKEEAEAIIKRAEAEAELTAKAAEEGIKHEIVNVSTLLAEKMLEREINEKDHHALIDSFIERIGETDESDE